jgi:formiminotetrahydrofolate cyclodeaminase
VDEDTDAFNRVIDAMRLPKGTPGQQTARDRAIAEANKAAAEVPLQTARHCLAAIELAGLAANKGNRHSSSDAGVAALAARAGVEGAVLNVLINLGGIKDEAFKQRCVQETSALAADADRLCDAVYARVISTLHAKP